MPRRSLAGCDADVVLNGITGSIGLRPTLAALRPGRTLALANKESLIVGGPLVKAAAKPGQIVPVDSEHSALAQCLRGGTRRRGARLVVTASGGPFRGPYAAPSCRCHARAGPGAPDLGHGPGRSRSTRATLVNKGLEVIEAHLLFDIPFDRIDVVVHPQSVVHSMVEFVDGSTLAQATPAGHALPIALGLGWPERAPGRGARPATGPTAATWEFVPLDDEAFPAVGAGPAGRDGRRHRPGGLQRRQRGVRRGVPRRRIRVHRASSTRSARCRRRPRRRPTATADARRGRRRRTPGPVLEAGRTGRESRAPYGRDQRSLEGSTRADGAR